LFDHGLPGWDVQVDEGPDLLQGRQLSTSWMVEAVRSEGFRGRSRRAPVTANTAWTCAEVSTRSGGSSSPKQSALLSASSSLISWPTWCS